MSSVHHLRQGIIVAAIGSLLSGCFGYDPTGPEPEAKKTPIQPAWSNADVDQVVEVTYETIPASFQVDNAKLPAACNKGF